MAMRTFLCRCHPQDARRKRHRELHFSSGPMCGGRIASVAMLHMAKSETSCGRQCFITMWVHEVLPQRQQWRLTSTDNDRMQWKAHARFLLVGGVMAHWRCLTGICRELTLTSGLLAYSWLTRSALYEHLLPAPSFGHPVVAWWEDYKIPISRHGLPAGENLTGLNLVGFWDAKCWMNGGWYRTIALFSRPRSSFLPRRFTINLHAGVY